MRMWLTIAVLGLIASTQQASAQLRVEVRYPSRHALIAASGDSTFLFGSVSDPRATLRVAGQRVTVDPSGGWLAWIAIPRDSAFVVRVTAQLGGRQAIVSHPLRRADWIPDRPVWVDARSMQPVGEVFLPAHEPITLTVRAAPGAEVRLIVAKDSVVHFEADAIAAPAATGLRQAARYFAIVTGDLAPSVDGGVLAGAATPARPPPVLELIHGTDTLRVPWPLHITRHSTPVWVRLDDDSLGTGQTDRMVNARAGRFGDYVWRFPTGTLVRADARIGGDLRVRLSESEAGWLPRAQAHAVAAPDEEGRIAVGPPLLDTTNHGVRLRLTTSRAVPVSAWMRDGGLEITLHDVMSQSASTVDPRAGLSYLFDSAGNYVLRVVPPWPIWGWRYRVEGTDIVVDVRRPPLVDPERPLAGRLIVIDPGHPPGGTCGPTGLCEPQANLAVAENVRELLLRAGARVVMTRRGPEALELEPRTVIADSLDADLLISIHHNALPDGVNPFVSVGTATYFRHPPSEPLARTVQGRLVRHLGLRNLGAIRGDLALVRPTWYPSVLTEGMFLIVPSQERLARSRTGRMAYATGVVEGVRAFLRTVAVSPRPTSLVPDMSPSPRLHTFRP